MKDVFVGGVKYTLAISTSGDGKTLKKRPGFHKKRVSSLARVTNQSSPFRTDASRGKNYSISTADFASP